MASQTAIIWINFILKKDDYEAKSEAARRTSTHDFSTDLRMFVLQWTLNMQLLLEGVRKGVTTTEISEPT